MSRKKRSQIPPPPHRSNADQTRVPAVLPGLSDYQENNDPRPSELYRMTARHPPQRTKGLNSLWRRDAGNGSLAPGVCNGATDLRWKAPPCLNYEEREEQKKSINVEMARFLDGFEWDWFSTYTFANPVAANGAHHMFQRHFEWLEERAGKPCYAFRGDEYGAINGRFHIHALLGNVGEMEVFCGDRLPPGTYGRPCCAVHSWPCGHARVYRYDPKIGATGYVTKYVTKDFGDWNLFGDFIPAREESPLQSRLDLDVLPIAIPAAAAGSEKPLLGANETEANAIAAAGRRIELLEAPRAFDETELLKSPLFDGLYSEKQLLFPT